MIDMHAHLSDFSQEELELRVKNNILTCFSTGTPKEWQAMQPFLSRRELLVSFGLHPWYCGRYSIEECLEYLEQCDFIGEIGMDSVWCDIPLPIQQKQLERQLQIAADLKKPIILHTKGQEERIADIIRDFPQKVCVHWYSGSEEVFEKFLEQDCYFTLGPDTAALCRQKTSLTCKMLREIPAGRLFVETDGISAVAWARGIEQADIREIPAVLKDNLEYAASVKKCSVTALKKCMYHNLQEFLSWERFSLNLE